jgi:hypothetical protein
LAKVESSLAGGNKVILAATNHFSQFEIFLSKLFYAAIKLFFLQQLSWPSLNHLRLKVINSFWQQQIFVQAFLCSNKVVFSAATKLAKLKSSLAQGNKVILAVTDICPSFFASNKGVFQQQLILPSLNHLWFKVIKSFWQ